jgi:glutamyl-tRNA synthetase
MNSNYIKSKDNNDILTIIKDHHQNLNIKIKDGDIYNQILTIIPSLKEKSKTINDLIELSSYLTRDDDEITVKNELLDINNQATNKHLTGIVNIIKNIKNWNIIEIENSIKSYIDDNDIKLFELAQPLRIVLTGSTVSIGIYDIITALGKNAVVNRVNKYLKN